MGDYCENCPMYWREQDYWGECDEGCKLWLDGRFDGEDFRFVCRMPRFVKKIYLAWYRFRCEVRWLKELNEREDGQEE